MDEKLISMKAFATRHLSLLIEPAQWEGWEDGAVGWLLCHSSNAICDCEAGGGGYSHERTGGKGGKEEQSDAPPSSQEVDDINKKLIILPPASSRGLARASHCSAHSPPPHTSHSPLPHKIMGWVVGERKVDGEVCEREGKETFCSPSRLAIDEYHQGSSTIDRASFSLGLWWLL